MLNRYILLFIFLFFCLKAFGLQSESEHFVYIYQSDDETVVDTIKSTLEQNYARITGDLQVTFQSKVRINIYPTLQQFHNAIGWPDAPDWIIGVGNSQLYIVSPLNPGPVHHYDEFFEYVLVHEFTHVCTNSINYGLPSWLSEGFACYEAGPQCDANDLKNDYKKLGKIPAIDELSSSYDQFVDLYGYDFSFILIKYLIENFGLAAVRDFIASPDDFSIFGGKTEAQIEEGWHGYLTDNYIEGTGINPENSGLNFSLFPNPIENSFSIKYNTTWTKFSTLIIYNNEGKIIRSFSGTDKFDISDFPAGIYHYKFTAGENTRFGKLVKK